jgi:spore germination protein GerM
VWSSQRSSSSAKAAASSASKTLTLNVFFSNSKKDPQMTECNKVYAVKRTVPYRKDVAQAALEELFKGPSSKEKAAGYTTSLPKKVHMNKLSLTGDTATVDFDKTLQEGIGGSCRVTSIRAQITLTLRQFPSIKNVVISVNGDSETALQP